MLDLLAQNTAVRLLFLGFLFVIVVAGLYLAGQMVMARRLTRSRLLDPGPGVGSRSEAVSSLRHEQVEGAWIRLVNSVEKTGLSLVYSKDEKLRHQLAAAGYTASSAPRVYTFIRLAMVVGLPVLVFLLMWESGSTPSASAHSWA